VQVVSASSQCKYTDSSQDVSCRLLGKGTNTGKRRQKNSPTFLKKKPAHQFAEDRFSKNRLGSELESNLEGKKSSPESIAYSLCTRRALTGAVSGHSCDSFGKNAEVLFDGLLR
jgi:hypothetical protein